MIKKITVEAISLRKEKKDGTPYMWTDKKTNTKKPRTMVSLKDSEGNWYTGWSYRDGSAAETVQKGESIEVVVTEDIKQNEDGSTSRFLNWRFPKEEDRKDAEIEELKRKLATQESEKKGPVSKDIVTMDDIDDGSVDEPPF